MAVETIVREGVPFHQSDLLSSFPALVHGFSTRLGGVSPAPYDSLNLSRTLGDAETKVRENYRIFAQATGANLAKPVLCHQIHSDRIFCVTAEDALLDLYDTTPFEGDALISRDKDVVLFSYYADCTPILLYDPVQEAIGAVHSGWRGTSLNIAGKTVRAMQEAFGTNPADLRLAIGAGICPQCFETHEDVPLAFREQFGSCMDGHISPIAGGKFQVNLKGVIWDCLLEAGIFPQHIEVSGHCSCCEPDLFWSHRRLGRARGNQAALISMNRA